MRVAEECQVSRQFVHMTLFPDKAEDLFGTTVTQRMIWTQTAKLVFSHELYDTMRLAFITLEKEKRIIMRVPITIINFFMLRAESLGLKSIILEKELTSPITYEIALAHQ